MFLPIPSGVKFSIFVVEGRAGIVHISPNLETDSRRTRATQFRVQSPSTCKDWEYGLFCEANEA